MTRQLLLISLALSTVALSAMPAEACTIWQTEASIDLHFRQGMPVPYYIQEGGSADIDDGSEFQAIQNAFETWTAADCGDGDSPGINFEYMGTTDADSTNFDPRFFRDEKSMVAFVQEGWEGDPGVLARARILWDSDTGEIREFGIGLNDEFADWSTSDQGTSGSFDVHAVLMRQIGLIMGLGDSEVEAAVMAPGFMSGSVVKRNLDNNDVIAICELYLPGRDYSDEVNEDSMCAHDLHPGARPPEPGNNNNGGNNGDNNSTNNENNSDNNSGGNNNEPEPDPVTDLGAGENCTDSSQCIEGLVCGCPLESCVSDICYDFTEPPAPAAAADDEGCATTPGSTGSGSWMILFLGAVWWLRRRATVSDLHR